MNKYDDETFFRKYSEMNRSKYGLEYAGEWESFKKLLPKLENKTILDLGCGYGWHLIYAAKKNVKFAVGIDISKKMLEVAKEKTKNLNNIELILSSIEKLKYIKSLKNKKFDIVLSSLALHYIKDFDKTVKDIKLYLNNNSYFLFSVEHPIFTAEGSEDWIYDSNGEIKHFPIDNYFYEGKRETNFLDEKVLKYHRTLTTYINTLIKNGFVIKNIIEPTPNTKLLKTDKSMQNELRRPMMLIIKSKYIPKY